MDSEKEEFSMYRLQEIKETIGLILSESNVYDSIREVIKTYLSSHNGELNEANDREEVMEILRERGVLTELIDSIRQKGAIHNNLLPTEMKNRSKVNWSIDGNKTYLHVKMIKGAAFIDNLNIELAQNNNIALFCSLQFGEQRVQTELVTLSSDPVFNEDFVFCLDATKFGFSSEQLLEISTPLHIAIFRENVNMNTATMIGENIIDWRKTLLNGCLNLSVELCGRNSGVSPGIIELQLELLPYKTSHYSEQVIARRLESERGVISASDREFLIYSRRWWNEYQSIRSTHNGRKVKLFASMSNGRIVPVTHFVSPLQSLEMIYSPYDAARFVSLLATVDNDTVERNDVLQCCSNSNDKTWKSIFTFLNERQGSSCDHVLLLCSLLLGFHLDAYCAIGSDKKDGSTTMYVLTRMSLRENNKFRIMLWDAVSGLHFPLEENVRFDTIDCVFNHRAFYANIQLSNSTLTTSFDFDNINFWKPINPLKLRMVVKMPGSIILCHRPLCNPLNSQIRLEMELRTQLIAYRDIFGAMTTFNDNMSYCLAQSLDEYERQRCRNGQDEENFFEVCIKSVLGPGMTFKAIPINVSCLSSSYMFSVIKGTTAGKQIIDTVAENVCYGLRVRVFPFPEGVVSVWAILAVAYNVSRV